MQGQWKKLAKKLDEAHSANMKNLKCLKFDGKKSAIRKDFSQFEGPAEQITVIAEPDGHYLHLFLPQDGSGYAIASCILEIILLYDSMDTIKAVGGDGTAANTVSIINS